MNTALQRQLDSFKARGFGFTIKDGNTIVITHIPEQEQHINKFYSEHCPCWFEGCEELRAQYLEELANLSKENCPSCKKGELMRKYRPRIEQALESANERITGSKSLSRSAGESKEGTPKRQSLLRRTTGYIAKIFTANAGPNQK